MKAKTPTTRKAPKMEKMTKVMKEYKAGTLHSGSKNGSVVKSRKQAVAIGLHEAGMARAPKMGMKNGY
jgi:hypothetical protein